jgi:formylglycine-generating enzyme required for sulfatase activity
MRNSAVSFRAVFVGYTYAAVLVGMLALAPLQRQAVNPTWGLVIEAAPDAAVVIDATVRDAISKSGLPWKVRHLSSGIEFVLVPAGRFRMGASNGDTDAVKAESPAHEVVISKPFYIGRTEVTQGQWQSIMGSNPSRFQAAFFREEALQRRKAAIAEITANGSTKQEAEELLGPRPIWIDDTRDFPLDSAPFAEVEAFCMKAGVKLPTEAQWEYACRAGSSAPTFGPLESIAWCGANSGERTHAVATAAPNAFGLHDTLGNVWEWTADLYLPNAYAQRSASTADPAVTGSGPRAVRGGNWLSLPKTCRASCRIPAAEVRIPRISSEDRAMAETDGAPKYPAYGFRVVLEP